MKMILMGVATAAMLGAIFLSWSMSEQAAIAASDDGEHMDSMEHMEPTSHEYRFTQTTDSALSPGLGHETHQIVRVLEPSDGIIYAGTVSYVASEPIDIVILHEMNNEDSRGQAIWRIDDDRVYGWTFMDIDSKVGYFEYSGAGLLFHTGGDEFTATYTAVGSAQESQVLNITSSIDAP
ncbi:MAG: hypothetical protein F4Y18_03830 [Cenarchaeum sp. SB0663_bin_5]|nr:hypothetical protein [Cenarchaeum sp. SB0663_bin_5]MYH04318.1 hypothetical protein [Cenarchaeum sp. SB0675_bin_21]MYL11084.1 hypothetical protein [Cenarchaeum sp. SB0669_bin_11]